MGENTRQNTMHGKRGIGKWGIQEPGRKAKSMALVMITLRTNSATKTVRNGKENERRICRTCARDRERDNKIPGKAGRTGTILFGRG